MRFADIRKKLRDGYSVEWAITATVDALAAQEAIRESVPVRSPGPGPSLADQIAHMREAVAFNERYRLDDFQYTRHAAAVESAILASLERLAREEDDGR